MEGVIAEMSRLYKTGLLDETTVNPQLLLVVKRGGTVGDFCARSDPTKTTLATLSG